MNRQPRGVPTGGQFAASERAEADLRIAGPTERGTQQAQPTRQTSAPIEPLTLRIDPRRAKGLADLVRDGDLDLNPEYQRGSVWTESQRIELIRSFLSKTPIPAVVINNRATVGWRAANGTSPREAGGAAYVAIDGKQRIETVRSWFDDDLAVPSSWFPTEDVERTTLTDDGPYVTWSGLSRRAQMDFAQNATLPVAEGTLPTVAEEASMYLRVNGAGTAQSADDLANAARVADQDRIR